MRSARPSTSVSAQMPPRVRSHARTSPTVATSAGTSTASSDRPSASRTLAKYLSWIFIGGFGSVVTRFAALVQQFGKRNEAHGLAGADRMIRRVVDQPVAPDGRRQHRGTLVREQIEAARRIDARAQELVAAIALLLREIRAQRQRARRHGA